MTSLRQEVHRWEFGAEDVLGLRVEPLFEDAGVDGAEVDVELEVAVVEVLEVGRLAVDAAFDAVPDDEHGRGGPVVSAIAAVLGDAAAKFGEGHDQDVVSLALSF